MVRVTTTSRLRIGAYRLLSQPLQPRVGFLPCFFLCHPVTFLQLRGEVLTPPLRDLVPSHFGCLVSNGRSFDSVGGIACSRSSCSRTFAHSAPVFLVEGSAGAFRSL